MRFNGSKIVVVASGESSGARDVSPPDNHTLSFQGSNVEITFYFTDKIICLVTGVDVAVIAVTNMTVIYSSSHYLF